MPHKTREEAEKEIVPLGGGYVLDRLLIFSKIIEGDRSFEAEPIHSEYVSPLLIVGFEINGGF